MVRDGFGLADGWTGNCCSSSSKCLLRVGSSATDGEVKAVKQIEYTHTERAYTANTCVAYIKFKFALTVSSAIPHSFDFFFLHLIAML